MLQLSLNVTVDRTWYGARRGVSLSAELTSHSSQDGEIPVSIFLEQLARVAPELMPTLSSPESSGDVLRDFRGRPADGFSESAFKHVKPTPADSPLESVPIESLPIESLRRLQEEELFYTRGTLLPLTSSSRPPSPTLEPGDVSRTLAARDAADEDDDVDTELPFVIRVHSKFDSFQGAHIAHRVIRTISPVLDEVTPTLSVRLLSRLVPARLDTVRLGVENFKPRRFSGMLGFVATVTDRLYLEVNRSSIRILSQADLRGTAKKETGALPLSEQILLEKVDESLRCSGLFPNLLEQIRGAIED